MPRGHAAYGGGVAVAGEPRPDGGRCRHMTTTLTCPKCGSDMRQYERNRVLVDQCTGCGGLFLDRGELERLTAAENEWHQAPSGAARNSAAASGSTRRSRTSSSTGRAVPARATARPALQEAQVLPLRAVRRLSGPCVATGIARRDGAHGRWETGAVRNEPSGRDGPRRPAFFSPAAMEAQGGTVPDPAEVTEVAHATAAVLVGTGRAAEDPAVTAKLVALVDELGLSTAGRAVGRPARAEPARCAVAPLRPARVGAAQPRGGQRRLRGRRTLHRRQPRRRRGRRAARARRRCAALADAILRGVFEGDLAVALRAGGGVLPRRRPPAGPTAPTPRTRRTPTPRRAQTRRASSLLSTAEDLEACARLWRVDELL